MNNTSTAFRNTMKRVTGKSDTKKNIYVIWNGEDYEWSISRDNKIETEPMVVAIDINGMYNLLMNMSEDIKNENESKYREILVKLNIARRNPDSSDSKEIYNQAVKFLESLDQSHSIKQMDVPVDESVGESKGKNAIVIIKNPKTGKKNTINAFWDEYAKGHRECVKIEELELAHVNLFLKSLELRR